ncbi:MAG TPA: hypothetical protein VG389_07710 [Myxococcota bacterium]|jgi:hypothetical protein|nr:hypothetical protein [Myxococcota bacterium]
MNRKKSTDIEPLVRTDAGVTVGMKSVQIGTVQSGLPTATTGRVVVYDPSRPPAWAGTARDPRRDPTR